MNDTRSTPLPTRDELLTFLRDSPTRLGKRELARAFGLKGADRVALKQMLSELSDEGLLDRGEKRRFGAGGMHLPPVAVLEVIGVDKDGELYARPANWTDAATPPPLVVMAPVRKGETALGQGDRALCKLRPLAGDGPYRYEARPIKALGGAKRVLGVYRDTPRGGRLVPVDKRADEEFRIEEAHRAGAEDGDLIEAEVLRASRAGLKSAKVVMRLGDINAPRAISLIAIHEHGIPVEFDAATLAEAEAAQPVTGLKGREDLRKLPLLTIDPEDARDHDDAVFAEADDDPANPGGWIVWVAIADVAHYVRPGSALDHDARRRGNSVYFPDRVVPMLPDTLSGDLCSLHEGVDRPVLALRMVLTAEGRKTGHRFMRAMMRSAASLSYEEAQDAIDGAASDRAGPLLDSVIRPLFGAYAAAAKARAKRAPLDLDLPERRVTINDEGQIESIRFRDRFDAHRLIEEFMILANVCAAETLEDRRQGLLYRVHEEPLPERIESLREMLESIGFSLAKGQRIEPKRLNEALAAAHGTDHAETVNMSVLRAQTQAYYAPENFGHFGLNLRRYAHFTSPIRRYADLLVHRALIRGLGLGPDARKDGLTIEEEAMLAETGKHISMTERRAMTAERDSTDRYVAAYLADRLGAEFEGRVSGVAKFGFFVRLDETGADGLVPASMMGDDFYRYDAEAQILEGARSGKVFRIGMAVTVRLREAAPLTGGLIFELLGARGDGGGRPRRGGKARAPVAKKARKGAIRKANAGRKARRPQ